MIVAANHLSYADWPAMALFVHEAGRYPAFLIKSSAFDVKLIGPYLRVLGQLPVRRGQADAAQRAQGGRAGPGRGRVPGHLPGGHGHPRPGPVADGGQDRRGPAGAGHRRPGGPGGPVGRAGHPALRQHPAAPGAAQAVRMLAGPPVDLSDYEGKPLTRDVLRGATDAIMADITGLLAELRGEQPPAVPYHPAAARRAARQAAREQHARRRPAAQATGTDAQDRAGPQASAGPRQPPALTRTRRRRREGGGHGGRHVGHHVRPGALRRRHPGCRSGPAGPSWRRRSTTRHENPDYLPGVALTARADRERRPGPGAGRRGRGRAGRARPDAARQPHVLAGPAARRRGLRQPDEGDRARHRATG